MRQNDELIATARWLVGLVAAAVVLVSPRAVVASTSVTAPLLYSVCLVSQTAARNGQAAKAALTRKEVDQLLAQARKAIQRGDWQTAEKLVMDAERSNVRYTFFNLDTPARVRRDLEKARAARRARANPPDRLRPVVPKPLQDAPSTEPLATQEPMPRVDIQPAESTATVHPRGTTSPAIRFPQSITPAQLYAPADRQASIPRADASDDDGQRTADPATLSAGHAKPDDSQETTASLATHAAPDAGTLKAQVLALLKQARAALDKGELDRADLLVQKAISLNVPDSQFRDGEDRPWLLALKVRNARTQKADSTRARQPPPRSPVQSTEFVPANDGTANVPASALFELPHSGDHANSTQSPDDPEPTREIESPDAASASESAADDQGNPFNAVQTSDQGTPGDAADAAAPSEPDAPSTETTPPSDADTATNHPEEFPTSAEPAGESGVSEGDASPESREGESLIDRTNANQQVAIQKFSADVIDRLVQARHLRVKESKRAVELLRETRTMVAGSQLPAEARAQLMRRVERSFQETEKYIEDHRAEIERDERNRQVLDDLQRWRKAKIEVSQQLAKLVEQFNQLRDEQRFEEMEVVAKRARELAPDEPIAQQLWENARFLVRYVKNQELADQKEGLVFNALQDVDESVASIDPRDPFVHPDAKEWEELTRTRARRRREQGARRSPKELEIEQKLKSPVSAQFKETPLSAVIDQLSRASGVNIHLDERGLADEGISSDTPVTIQLNEKISLRSVLNLILEDLHLSYVIKDEVLKITSEQLREGETYPESYDVADLVIPIPNFVPGSHFGLQGAIADAQSTQGYGLAGGGFTAPMAVMASKDGTGGSGMINPQMLAQIPGAPNGALGPSAPGMPIGTGPGGLGGGTQADFDALIELITTTIEPDSWEENGGTGSIAEFETNLSIVVSATQEVHEQIVDLLEQLRRLQDLQVTIEVRFITLSDSFFERIGIDFDFFIEDSANPLRFVGPNLAGGLAQRDQRQNPSATVGLQPTNPPSFTADLDIPFTQDSFLAATPQFGGFDAAGAANFGFAILSDIEAFFLIQAAQGDTRSNVLQAPKVTLFNGQTAFVADTAQRPFVISVIPVVGDFAAAQQPVVVVLSEGTSMSVQAVVSPDRRYVRLTVVPFFSQIGDVDTFTFDGASSTTDSSSSSVDDDDDTVINSSEENTIMRQGTTVQLPTFAFVTVTTTVSVPDGGTVLLGGIKRLAEGRNEFGVPMLSKIPYVNRLFRNVGIGRETESLMMMVTPRIIIQEEEEERLLGASSE